MGQRIPIILLGLALLFAGAQPTDIGFGDFSYSGLSTPTGEKPQSKLWYNDGRWWADMLHSDGKHYIFYLDRAAQRWLKTDTQLDPRTTTKSDCRWDGAHLYVASGGGLESTAADLDGVLYRYSYNSANKTYTRDFGPKTIRPGGAETIVIDKDTTGRLWVTFAQLGKIYISHSLGSDQQWAAPFRLPAGGVNTTIAADDISSLIAFSGKIGVFWSNQLDSTFYFAVHADGDDPKDWIGSVVLRASNIADDHINIKSLQGDATGRLFAVVKTSLAEATDTTPRILLLARQPNGSWQSTIVSSSADHQTRPLLLVNTSQRQLYVFTADASGGIIYMKQSGMDNLRFAPGKGTPFIGSATATSIDNSTSTKQNVSRSTGIAVLASDDLRRQYLHNNVNLGPTGSALLYAAYLPAIRR
jgi:hypothetical protein